MHYTLHQLQVFLKISETCSITKAAEELHLTQPAVSIQLKNFQEQFDFPLTEIVGRKLFITDFGKEIAEAAERILNEVAAINQKVHTYKGHLTGRLKISVVSTGKYVMPFFLADFLRANPGVELKLDVTNRKMVIDSLERNEVDFALMSIIPDHFQIEKIPLLSSYLHLIGNKDYVITTDKIEQMNFDRTPFIFRELGSGTRLVMEEFIRKSDLAISKHLELTSNEAVKQAVIAGLGCSLMPLIGIRNEMLSGELKIIPTRGLPVESTWNMISVKNKKFSPAADAFRKYILENKDAIAERYFSWQKQMV